MMSSELLHELVAHSIGTAEEQIKRSRQLVAQSQVLIARIKRSLAHSARIQQNAADNDVAGSAKNSLIQPDHGSEPDKE